MSNRRRESRLEIHGSRGGGGGGSRWRGVEMRDGSADAEEEAQNARLLHVGQFWATVIQLRLKGPATKGEGRMRMNEMYMYRDS